MLKADKFRVVNLVKQSLRISFSLVVILTMTGCYEWWAELPRIPVPVAILKNAPVDVSAVQQLGVSVTGSSVFSYRYKLGLASTTDCNLEAGYSTSVLPAGTPISDSLLSFADQFVNLCVVAVSADGKQQSFATASTVKWYVDTTPATVTVVETEQSAQEVDSSTKYFTLNVDVAKPYPINVTYSLGGDSTPGLDHNIAYSGVAVIPANTLSYQYPFHLYLNTFSNVSKELRFTLKSTDKARVDIGNRSVSRFVIYDTDGGIRPTVADYSSDGQTTCVVLSNGILKCWGYNGNGQVGDGTTVNKTTPVVIDSGVAYSAVRIGVLTTCGITTGGVLKCWGANAYNQLANGTTTDASTPVVIDAGTNYSKVNPGNRMCAITTLGVLKCWGLNTNGRVGNGSTTTVTTPTAIGGALRFASVSTVTNNTCAITTVGTGQALYCWGAFANGMPGSSASADVLSPTVVTSGTAYSTVALDGTSACAITVTGSQVKCWGAAGVVGDGTSTARTAPIAVDGTTAYAFIFKRTGGTCGITSTGILKCWGTNAYAQLGDGTTTDRTAPVVIDSGTSYSSVVLGVNTTCGVTAANVLKCWGYASGLATGIVGANPYSSGAYIATPTVVDAGVSYAAASVQTNGNTSSSVGLTCAVTTSGRMKCWGDNGIGQNGDGSATSRMNPLVIDAGTNYSRMTTSAAATCAITSGGVLKCWGFNNFGQLGDGTRNNKAQPTVIDSGTLYREILTTGGGITCGLTTANILKCWGSNAYGQVGDGTKLAVLFPKVVDAGTSYVKIAMWQSNICGITTGNVLKCWANNANGQVGNGTLVEQLTPTVVDSGTLYQDVALSMNTTCGITTSKILKCWGLSAAGQTGSGLTSNVLTPTVIDSGTLYKQIAMNFSTTCGLTDLGAVKCWGSNLLSQNGSGIVAGQFTTPQAVDASTVYTKIFINAYSSFGITNAGVLKAWGFNSSAGQLGDGTLTNRSTPVVIDAGTSYSNILSYFHSCGITSAAAMKCWGDNSFGQTGVGTTATQTIPGLVDSGTSYVSVLTDSNSTFAISSSGVLKGWGRNDLGQLGDSPFVVPAIPRDITKWLTP